MSTYVYLAETSSSGLVGAVHVTICRARGRLLIVLQDMHGVYMDLLFSTTLSFSTFPGQGRQMHKTKTKIKNTTRQMGHYEFRLKLSQVLRGFSSEIQSIQNIELVKLHD